MDKRGSGLRSPYYRSISDARNALMLIILLNLTLSFGVGRSIR